jgi:hypothetical protein
MAEPLDPNVAALVAALGGLPAQLALGNGASAHGGNGAGRMAIHRLSLKYDWAPILATRRDFFRFRKEFLYELEVNVPDQLFEDIEDRLVRTQEREKVSLKALKKALEKDSVMRSDLMRRCEAKSNLTTLEALDALEHSFAPNRMVQQQEVLAQVQGIACPPQGESPLQKLLEVVDKLLIEAQDCGLVLGDQQRRMMLLQGLHKADIPKVMMDSADPHGYDEVRAVLEKMAPLEQLAALAHPGREQQAHHITNQPGAAYNTLGRGAPRTPNQPGSCGQCGRRGHQGGEKCVAKGMRCFWCNKMGHIKPLCPDKLAGKVRAKAPPGAGYHGHGAPGRHEANSAHEQTEQQQQQPVRNDIKLETPTEQAHFALGERASVWHQGAAELAAELGKERAHAWSSGEFPPPDSAPLTHSLCRMPLAPAHRGFDAPPITAPPHYPGE